MDFKQLESFVAVVDEGSFSNAADRLQLSQSMVTIHVRNLETELGTRLLNRTTRSMELSNDGKTFYYYAKQMLRLNRDSMFALTRADQDEKSINIVATPYTSRYYLSNRIVEFKRMYPDVNFIITVCYNSEIHNKLRAGGFEFAFCNMKIMDSDYAVKHYNSSSLVVITPNEERFRKLQGQPLPAEIFGEEPLITRSSTSALPCAAVRWRVVCCVRSSTSSEPFTPMTASTGDVIIARTPMRSAAFMLSLPLAARASTRSACAIAMAADRGWEPGRSHKWVKSAVASMA